MPISRWVGWHVFDLTPGQQDVAVGGFLETAIIISVVVLPEPLGPSRLTNSPARTSSEAPRTA